MTPKRLKKDLVIPAGTVFNQAPIKTVNSGRGIEAIIGLSDNTAGSLTYFPDDDPDEMAEWFEEVKED